MTTAKKKILVVVPFAMSPENLALRQAQLKGIDLSPNLEFEFRTVKDCSLKLSPITNLRFQE